MLVGLLLLAVILMLGGGPSGDRIGFRTWNDPGAVKEHVVGGAGGRFTAFLYVWVFSGFSFYFGPELIITTSGEMYHPRKNLPIASRRFFYRLAFFYVFGALAIGAICRSDAEDLTSGAGNANASPWVIAIRNAGISALPSIVNGGILTSAWSAGNSFLYMSSRSLVSRLHSQFLSQQLMPSVLRRSRWQCPQDLQTLQQLRSPHLRRRRNIAVLSPRIPERHLFCRYSVQLADQPHKHCRIYLLDRMLHHLPTFPQSLRRARCHGGISVQIPALRRIHLPDCFHGPVAVQWIHAVLSGAVHG